MIVMAQKMVQLMPEHPNKLYIYGFHKQTTFNEELRTLLTLDKI